MNPFAREFVPGGLSSSAPAPQPEPQPAPKDNWDDAVEEKAEPKAEEKPIVKEEPKPSTTAPAPTTSTFKLDEDYEEGDDGADGDADAAEVEKKLKKLNWGNADTVDPREHLNIVFIGHVDAGKSTCSGQVLFLTGMVDDRTIQKFQKDATDKNRGSWFLAYIMDTIEEERAKGKTVEVGRAHFETEKKRYTILDAPGHRNFVPNMIMGVAQADVGILVISARKGEFEAGYDRSGQTREHAILARTLGVKSIVIAVNKMDEPSVEWSQARYDDIVTKVTKFLQGLGYNPKEDIHAVPIAGLTGANIKEKLADGVCSWYKGESLIGLLDAMKPMFRQKDAALRIPVLDKFKDMGQVNVMGKVEAGRVRIGQTVLFQPGGLKAEVVALANDMADLNLAECGENIRLVVKGIEEEHIHKGFVVCDPSAPIPVATEFVAQLTILELPEGKSLFTAGYAAVIHIHTVVEECTVVRLLAEIDPKTKEITKKLPKFSKSRCIVNVHIQLAQSICMESFKEFPQLGRFTLRDEGKTIALGKVLYQGPPRKKPAAK